MRHATTAGRVCAEPGCAQLLASDERYCQAHRRVVAPRGGFGYTLARYQQARSRYLREHPICEWCDFVPAAHVHHRDGLGPRGPRGCDPRNLQALCASCHSRVTAREHGPGTRAKRHAGLSR